MDAETLAGAQIASIVVCVLVIFVEVVRVYRDPKVLPWALPVVIWMVATLVYYAFLLHDQLFHGYEIKMTSYTYWSAVIRLFSHLTVLVCEGGRLVYSLKRRDSNGC